MSIVNPQSKYVSAQDLAIDVISEQDRAAIARDDTLKSFQEALRKAYFDNLTQIHNRDGVETYLKRAKELNLTLRAVGAVDFNGFKIINSKYSHEGGDQVLAQFAQRANDLFLNQVDEPGVIFNIARWGGDEFAIIVLTNPGIEISDERIGELVGGVMRASDRSPAKAQLNGESVLIPFSVEFGLSKASPHLNSFKDGWVDANFNLDELKSGRDSFVNAMKLDFVNAYFEPLLKEPNGNQIKLRYNRSSDIPLIEWMLENDPELKELMVKVKDYAEQNPDCGIDFEKLQHYMYPAIRPGHRPSDVVDIGPSISR